MKKILIAEDDNFLANAYRVKLAASGFEVRIASDGESVFKVLSEFKPDLIILDLIMPLKDGFVVLQELKLNENYKNIPVVIASNLGQESDINRGMSLGAIDFIVKSSVSLTEIIHKINNILH